MLRTAADQGDDLVGTEKTVPVNQPDDLSVSLHKPHVGDCGGAFEAGKTGVHQTILPDAKQARQASRFALCGNVL